MIPTIGRIVLVNIGKNPTKHDSETEHLRPAVVVRVWGDTPQAAVNVQLLTDCDNDIGCEYFANNQIIVSHIVWLTSICPGDGVGQWRWPPRV